MAIGAEAIEGGDDLLAGDFAHGIGILETGAPAKLGQRLAGLLLNQGLIDADDIIPAEIGAGAGRIVVSIEADDRRADNGGHMGWAGVGGQHQTRLTNQRQQLLEVGLANQIDRFALAELPDLGGQIPLQFGWPATEIDLKTLAGGVIRQCCIARSRPVFERLAGGCADQQGRFATNLLFRPGLVFGADGQLPIRGQILDAELFGKGEETVQHVGRGGRGYLVVGEQPLAVVGPLPIKPEFDPGLDAEGGDAGAHGRLQMQQGIKLTPPEGLPQVAIAAPPLALVEGDHLDTGQIGKQGCLDFSGDPGDAGLRPLPLDDPYQCQRVAAVADGGEPQNADGGGRRLK